MCLISARFDCKRLDSDTLSDADVARYARAYAAPEHLRAALEIYRAFPPNEKFIHYCPTNNQPRMRAVPTDNAIMKLEFVFTGAGNLPDSNVGHEQKLVLQFTDEDHITERWTWRRNGKDTEMVFRFVRIGPGHKSSEKSTRD